MFVFDSDDFGANHVISDMCQSHDCRDKLDEFHYANPNFKVTLFTIPFEMTMELAEWCKANAGWVELAVHGFRHTSNYECEKMTYEEFDKNMKEVFQIWGTYGRTEWLFTNGFKAPGWQISDGAYQWLKDNGWWVADQDYNTNRRPSMKAYINRDGTFFADKVDGQDRTEVEAIHTHTWNCVGNGVYELSDQIKQQIKDVEEFKFVSEVLQ